MSLNFLFSAFALVAFQFPFTMTFAGPTVPPLAEAKPLNPADWCIIPLSPSNFPRSPVSIPKQLAPAEKMELLERLRSTYEELLEIASSPTPHNLSNRLETLGQLTESKQIAIARTLIKNNPRVAAQLIHEFKLSEANRRILLTQIASLAPAETLRTLSKQKLTEVDEVMIAKTALATGYDIGADIYNLKIYSIDHLRILRDAGLPQNFRTALPTKSYHSESTAAHRLRLIHNLRVQVAKVYAYHNPIGFLRSYPTLQLEEASLIQSELTSVGNGSGLSPQIKIHDFTEEQKATPLQKIALASGFQNMNEQWVAYLAWRLTGQTDVPHMSREAKDALLGLIRKNYPGYIKAHTTEPDTLPETLVNVIYAPPKTVESTSWDMR